MTLANPLAALATLPALRAAATAFSASPLAANRTEPFNANRAENAGGKPAFSALLTQAQQRPGAGVTPARPAMAAPAPPAPQPAAAEAPKDTAVDASDEMAPRSDSERALERKAAAGRPARNATARAAPATGHTADTEKHAAAADKAGDDDAPAASPGAAGLPLPAVALPSTPAATGGGGAADTAALQGLGPTGTPLAPLSPGGGLVADAGTDGATRDAGAGVGAVTDASMQASAPGQAHGARSETRWHGAESLAAAAAAASKETSQAGAAQDAAAATAAAGAESSTPAVAHGNELAALAAAAATAANASSGDLSGSARTDAATAVQTLNISAPVTSDEFRGALGTQISVLVQDGVQRAELQLNPAELGPISVSISMNGNQAQVDFGVDMAQTRDIIEAGWAELATALQDAGFTLSGGGVSQHAGGRQAGQGNVDEGGGRRSSRLAAVDEPGAVAAPLRRAAVASGGVDLYA